MKVSSAALNHLLGPNLPPLPPITSRLRLSVTIQDLFAIAISSGNNRLVEIANQVNDRVLALALQGDSSLSSESSSNSDEPSSTDGSVSDDNNDYSDNDNVLMGSSSSVQGDPRRYVDVPRRQQLNGSDDESIIQPRRLNDEAASLDHGHDDSSLGSSIII